MVLQPQSTTMITKQQQYIDFLNWLRNRMLYKYHDNDPNIYTNLAEVTEALKTQKFIVDKKRVIQICKKFYPMFEIEKDEQSLFDVGYSKKEKIDIFNHITNIITEYHIG